MNFYNFKKLINLRKKIVLDNNNKQNIDVAKQKEKAPNNRPNAAPSSQNLLKEHFQIVQRNQAGQIGTIVQS